MVNRKGKHVSINFNVTKGITGIQMNKLDKSDNLETIMGYVEEAYYELKAAEEELDELLSSLQKELDKLEELEDDN